jgi:hypothetical protein
MTRYLAVAALVTTIGCSSTQSWEREAVAYQAPTTSLGVYHECVNNLYSRPFYQKATTQDERTRLEIEWKAMCMQSIQGGQMSQSEYNNRMALGLILQQQYLNQLDRINNGRRY